ncbi:hypothetical protein NDU88_007149 [Pleurodeles waltl]|uniref:Uncharacterized protein n=1 Tax=Pleurodeles waltl TaxID=8319 RepID=A0AAV7PLN8_PLEWA|nr:hypothetical protein NDU88_007149 [Pleurodeles waltl]
MFCGPELCVTEQAEKHFALTHRNVPTSPEIATARSIGYWRYPALAEISKNQQGPPSPCTSGEPHGQAQTGPNCLKPQILYHGMRSHALLQGSGELGGYWAAHHC